MKRGSQSMKRLLSFIMAFTMVLTMLPLSIFAVGTGTTVYLVPNTNWKVDSARFAVYCYNSSGDKWVDMTATDVDGMYEATVPDGYTTIIFCRMNPSVTDNSWANKWNQTSDLPLPTDGTNCYTVAEGTWDKGGGTWSTYTPEPEEEETTAPTEPEPTVVAYLAGSMNDWSTIATPIFADTGATIDLEANTYEFKIVCNGQWYGNGGTIEDTTTATSDVGWQMNSDANCKLKATGGEYTFTFDAATKYLIVTHKPTTEEPVDPPVVETTYIIAGTTGLCGVEWDPAYSDNKMTLNADTGLYEQTFENVPVGTHSFKVTDGTWDNTWGGDGDNGNYEFTLDAISDVTITFNAETKEIKVTGEAHGGDSEGDPITVYFRNDWCWSEVSCYYWDYHNNNNGWPGAAMTKVGVNSGYDVYTAEVPAGTTGIIFNGVKDDGSGNRDQTPDIATFADGDAFYIHWSEDQNQVSKFDYASGDDTAKPEATYVIAGTAGLCGSAWDVTNANNAMTLNDDGVYEKTFERVRPGTHSFKVTDGTWNHSWGGNGADGNYEFKLENDGNRFYNVTVTFDADSKEITVISAKTDVTFDVVDNVTIHFRNTGSWDEVYYHAWVENGDNDAALTSWPGLKVQEDSGAVDGEPIDNWYTVNLTGLNAANGIGIIFNNGADNKKTEDILIEADDEYWYDGQLLTEAPATWPTGTVPEVAYKVTLHFANTKNWGSVNLYSWTMDGVTRTGSWPGNAADREDDVYYSKTFTYRAPVGQGLNFIFSGSGQTVDLALDAAAFTLTDGVYTVEKWVAPSGTNDEGKYYADIVSDPAAIAISPVVDGQSITFAYKNPDATSVSVFGSMDTKDGSWVGHDMVKNGYGVWTVTLPNVAYGLYEYKFVVDGNWIVDPLNSWVVNDKDGNPNSAVLISNPENDNNQVKINVHYEAPTAEWNVCAWGAPGLADQYDFTNNVATITLEGRASQYVCFKVRRSVGSNDWAEQSGEIRVDLANIVSGTIDVYVNSDFSVSQSLNDNVVTANKISSVELDYDNNTITIKTTQSVDDPENAFAIWYKADKDTAAAETNIISGVTTTGSAYTLTLGKTLDLVTLYQYSIRFSEQAKFTDYDYAIGINTVYASTRFGTDFTYGDEDGEDKKLGANWTKDSTEFVVWAPTAAAVSVNLYTSGTAGTDDLIESVPMEKGDDGVWIATVSGNKDRVYYTYAVTVDGETVEAVDPYARTTGVNGKRGMVIDLDSTDPAGWDEDCNPNPITSYTDAIIYELHVRDFSIDPSSGISAANRGKYMAFTEQGVTVDADEDGTNDGNVLSGIDYLKSMGFTHLHLLPVYDYGSVDESNLETAQFNWGYDPVNYNVPEGSYSTNPYDGATRVEEFKKMVKALHDADISVIMDVVYNHVYDAGKFCMNQIVPTYFSRTNPDGSYSNGSGCGNDTASEREMVRKYIVESVLYWHQEYHIDGFRFDLVGLLDATTINQIVNDVHACSPDVIFYGEGWTLGTAVEPGNGMATQANSGETPNFAYFSDTIRNLLGGSNGSSLGFVSGLTGQEEAIRDNFMARPWWTSKPSQIVQYASCHDNYTLVDKLVISTGKKQIDDEVIRMNNLAAAIYMTSQGIPFIHAGEEFLREKLDPNSHTDRCENSYNASDEVNHIEWSNLDRETYAANSDYYKGLIEFRKAHEALRMESNDDITQNIDYTWIDNEVVMFTINGSAVEGEASDSIVVIFNANKTKNTSNVPLPAGEWKVCVNRTQAGTEAIGDPVRGSVNVDSLSAMVLVQGETAHVPGEAVAENQTGDVCEGGSYDEVVKCSLCGEEMSRETITVEAQGHSWDDGVVTQEPTYTETGVKTYTCSGCGDTKTDVVPVKPMPTIERTGNTLNYRDYISVVTFFDLTGVEDIDLSKDAGVMVFTEDQFTSWNQDRKFDAAYAKAGMAWCKEHKAYYSDAGRIYISDLHTPHYYVGYVKVDENTYIFSEETLYSPKIYAYNMLEVNSDASEKTRELCIALLNYSAAMQKYVKPTIAEDQLANYDLTEEQKKLDWTNVELESAEAVPGDMKGTRDKTVFIATGKNIFFDYNVRLTAVYKISDTTVNTAKEAGTIFWTEEQFKALDQSTPPTIDNYGEGTVRGLVRKSNGQWVSHSPTITAKDLSGTNIYYRGYVVKADGTVSYTTVMSYNMEQYIGTQAAKNTALGTLCKALYYYERAVKAMFDNA